MLHARVRVGAGVGLAFSNSKPSCLRRPSSSSSAATNINEGAVTSSLSPFSTPSVVPKLGRSSHTYECHKSPRKKNMKGCGAVGRGALEKLRAAVCITFALPSITVALRPCQRSDGERAWRRASRLLHLSGRVQTQKVSRSTAHPSQGGLKMPHTVKSRVCCSTTTNAHPTTHKRLTSARDVRLERGMRRKLRCNMSECAATRA